MRSAATVESGRGQIIATAIEMFGSGGIEATSLREVAKGAGVSPALIVHHFGGKEGLVAAVDEEAVSRFGAAYAAAGEGAEAGTGAELLRRRAGQTARVMRERPDVCAYLGRALVERTPGAGRLFALMVGAGRVEIEDMAARGAIREDADRLWATLQHFFLIWAPLSFRALLEGEVVDGSLLEPPNLDRWVEANVQLFERGLYR